MRRFFFIFLLALMAMGLPQGVLAQEEAELNACSCVLEWTGASADICEEDGGTFLFDEGTKRSDLYSFIAVSELCGDKSATLATLDDDTALTNVELCNETSITEPITADDGTVLNPSITCASVNYDLATNSDGSSSTAGDPEFVSLANPLGNITTVPQIIGNVIRVALGILGSLTLFTFFIGAFHWITSAGYPQRVQKGMRMMLFSVIGLFVIFASYAILTYVFVNLGARSGAILDNAGTFSGESTSGADLCDAHYGIVGATCRPRLECESQGPEEIGAMKEAHDLVEVGTLNAADGYITGACELELSEDLRCCIGAVDRS